MPHPLAEPGVRRAGGEKRPLYPPRFPYWPRGLPGSGGLERRPIEQDENQALIPRLVRQLGNVFVEHDNRLIRLTEVLIREPI